MDEDKTRGGFVLSDIELGSHHGGDLGKNQSQSASRQGETSTGAPAYIIGLDPAKKQSSGSVHSRRQLTEVNTILTIRKQHVCLAP